jgi:hypothetical protein
LLDRERRVSQKVLRSLDALSADVLLESKTERGFELAGEVAARQAHLPGDLDLRQRFVAMSVDVACGARQAELELALLGRAALLNQQRDGLAKSAGHRGTGACMVEQTSQSSLEIGHVGWPSTGELCQERAEGILEVKPYATGTSSGVDQRGAHVVALQRLDLADPTRREGVEEASEPRGRRIHRGEGALLFDRVFEK